MNNCNAPAGEVVLLALLIAREREKQNVERLREEVLRQDDIQTRQPWAHAGQGFRQRGAASEARGGQLGSASCARENAARGQAALDRIEAGVARWRNRVRKAAGY